MRGARVGSAQTAAAVAALQRQRCSVGVTAACGLRSRWAAWALVVRRPRCACTPRASAGAAAAAGGPDDDAAPASRQQPPCVLHEDAHVLVVNKPSGWNTHAPAPLAGFGIFDWLRCREARWARISIVHRLDKDTSGVLIFGLSGEANRLLSAQFEGRSARKSYVFYSAAPPPPRLRAPAARPRAGSTGGGGAIGAVAEATEEADGWLRVRSFVRRDGERYASAAAATPGAEEAVTLLRLVSSLDEVASFPRVYQYEAKPLTGRTHQIRLHAAALGVPVLGDDLYGGAAAERVWLHAATLELLLPGDPERRVVFEAPTESPHGYSEWRRFTIAAASVCPAETTMFRIAHGAASSGGVKGTYADVIGPALLVQSDRAAADWVPGERERWIAAAEAAGCSSVYVKQLRRDVRTVADTEAASPRLLHGSALPERFEGREHALRYLCSFKEGYSYGIFLDQRDNRRRLLTGFVAPGFGPLWPAASAPDRRPRFLNCFSYTCAFSVAAAAAGAVTTSLDLSRKYLDWGRENLALNGLLPPTPAGPAGTLPGEHEHDFIFGDCFDWLRRLGNKGRTFDVVVCDPPTFSRSKQRGDWRAEDGWSDLAAAAVRVIDPAGGVLLASTNAARLPAETFLAQVRAGVEQAGRRVEREFFAPAAPDFPSTREEPAYLKTVWVRIAPADGGAAATCKRCYSP